MIVHSCVLHECPTNQLHHGVQLLDDNVGFQVAADDAVRRLEEDAFVEIRQVLFGSNLTLPFK